MQNNKLLKLIILQFKKKQFKIKYKQMIHLIVLNNT